MSKKFNCSLYNLLLYFRISELKFVQVFKTYCLFKFTMDFQSPSRENKNIVSDRVSSKS